MQINFLKIQQKSRENGLVIFSKSNFAIWRENFIVFKSQNNSWKDFILQKLKQTLRFDEKKPAFPIYSNSREKKSQQTLRFDEKTWLFLKFNKTHQKLSFWTQIGLLLQFVEQE